MFEHSLSPNDREWLFKLDHGLLDETEEEYITRKAAAVNGGETVWMARNFDSDGRVYGLWHETREIAVLDDEGDGNFRLYVRDVDGEDTMLDDTLSLIAGVDRAERYFNVSSN